MSSGVSWVDKLVLEIRRKGPLDVHTVQAFVGQEGKLAIREAGGIPKLCGSSSIFMYVNGTVALRNDFEAPKSMAPQGRRDPKPARYVCLHAQSTKLP
jgi:hypothetical protein